MSRVYYITHPDVVVDPAVPIPLWPLAPRGLARMRQLLRQPWVSQVRAVYCSQERKALDGAQVISQHLGLPYTAVAELGEVDRSSTGYLSQEALDIVVERFYAFPNESAQGWETAAQAQQRVVCALDDMLRSPLPGDIAIVAHGTVGALLLCALRKIPIDRKESQPMGSGGNYFCFEAQTRDLVHAWKRIDCLDEEDTL